MSSQAKDSDARDLLIELARQWQELALQKEELEEKNRLKLPPCQSSLDRGNPMRKLDQERVQKAIEPSATVHDFSNFADGRGQVRAMWQWARDLDRDCGVSFVDQSK